MPLPPRRLVADVDAPELLIDPAGVHHFERVLRLEPGEPIELVDGRGGLARGRWGRRGVLTQVEREPRAAPADAPFVLAVAPPRPSRLDWLVEKVVELGVARLQLLKTQHGARDVSPSRLKRLRRKAGEAMLQCRRLHRMEISAAATLDDILGNWSGAPPWLASLDAPVVPGLADSATHAAVLGLVGPEGGWHDSELLLAQAAGALPVGLGTGVLRVETAALALAVLAAQRRPGPGNDRPSRPAR